MSYNRAVNSSVPGGNPAKTSRPQFQFSQKRNIMVMGNVNNANKATDKVRMLMKNSHRGIGEVNSDPGPAPTPLRDRANTQPDPMQRSHSYGGGGAMKRDSQGSLIQRQGQGQGQIGRSSYLTQIPVENRERQMSYVRTQPTPSSSYNRRNNSQASKKMPPPPPPLPPRSNPQGNTKMLIGGVLRVKGWIKMKLPFPVLFHVYGKLSSPMNTESLEKEENPAPSTRRMPTRSLRTLTITSQPPPPNKSPRTKTTLVLQDLNEPSSKLTCVFYNIDRTLPTYSPGEIIKTVGRAQSDGSLQVFTYGPADPGVARCLPRLVFFSQRGIQLGLVQHRNSLEAKEEQGQSQRSVQRHHRI